MLENILVIVIIALLSAGSYFLIKSFLNERKKIKEEKTMLIDGVITRPEITGLITSHISRVPNAKFSLLYIDIDNYSDIVNAFGNKEAEKIVESLIRQVLLILPKGVKISRFSIDEFLIYISNDYERSYCLEIANKVKEKINTPVKLFGDTKITINASIAVAFYPIHGKTIKDLANSLKLAIYMIKKTGGNQIRVYSEDMDKNNEHVEYYYQIKRAITNNEFELVYQPMINIVTNKIYALEALLRWNHPEHGELTPNKFLNIMEQSGDVNFIGIWGLETIIKTYLELKQDFPDQVIMLSINLSSKQMINENLVPEFQKVLRKYRIKPNNFILEAAEFTLFEKNERVLANMKKLKELGFKIAIDGFGIDYQTLSKPLSIDIDIIKLDSEFLKEEEESYMKIKFASLLVDFAIQNNYEVVCESIENEKMLLDAKTYNIAIMQGYYFTKPLNSNNLKSFILSESWKKETIE